MLKRIRLFLIVVITGFLGLDAASSWQIDKLTNMPRVGDNFDIQNIEVMTHGQHGRNVLWDFSASGVISGIGQIRVVLRGENRIGIILDCHRTDYRVSGDALLWTGFENRLINMADSLPAIKLRYPLAYGDSCKSDYCFKGRYATDRAVVTSGRAHVFADGCGTLILPGGDTVRDVIRVRSDYYSNVRMGAALKVGQLPADVKPEILYRQYEWYARGYRYPLLYVYEKLACEDNGNTLIERQAYSVSRHSQEYGVRNDPDNELLRQQIYSDSAEKYPYCIKTVPEGNIDNAGVQMSGDNLVLEFDYAGSETSCELVVSNTAGITCLYIPRHAVSEGRNKISIDCFSLEKGEYALLLVMGDYRLPLKFTKRQ